MKRVKCMEGNKISEKRRAEERIDRERVKIRNRQKHTDK